MSQKLATLVAPLALALAACGTEAVDQTNAGDRQAADSKMILYLPPPLPPLIPLRTWSDRPLYPSTAKQIFTVLAAAPASADGSLHFRAYGVDVTHQTVVFNIDITQVEATGASTGQLQAFQQMVDRAANLVFATYPNPADGASSGGVGDLHAPGPGPVGPPSDGAPLLQLANTSVNASNLFFTPATVLR
jgi:hypothetical protein